MSRVLVVSSDVVGARMGGAGMRYWELASVLARRDHTVVLSAPRPLPASPPFEVVELRASHLGPRSACSDVTVVGLGYAIPGLERSRHLVVDLYDPFVLENLPARAAQPDSTGRLMHAHDLGLLLGRLQAGDFFLCASERQRHFWLGMLTAAGRINPLTHRADPSFRRLIDVVPFGTPEEQFAGRRSHLRERLGLHEDDVIALWGGGIWDWLDPLTLIRAAAEVRRHRNDLKVVFMGTRHPNPAAPRMEMVARARDLAAELGLLGTAVIFNDGWVPFGERADYLAGADIGVSLHQEHLESTFSFRTRVLDYMWAGLPLVVTAGDEMAEMAARTGSGAVVGYDDVAGVAAALERFAGDPGLRRRCGERSRQGAEALRWDRVAEPLAAYCASPFPAADRGRQARPRSGFALGAKAVHLLREEGVRGLARRAGIFVGRRL